MYAKKRKRLIERLKDVGVVKSSSVEKAFLKVNREEFMNSAFKDVSYEDNAFLLVEGQTISQPTTIALMLEELKAQPGHKVLEIGSGSGYVCALLEKIVGSKGKVFGIEVVKSLCELSKQNLKRVKSKAKVFCSDGKEGLTQQAPFDRILISAATPKVPKELLSQVGENGILLAPVGQKVCILTKFTKTKGRIITQPLNGLQFVFVPLV
ncbi:MAG: protein-L-isoaspartate(D-aspartate) O-methyltransferase [Candidatus Diapherotrites archaeon]|nr:protein-L-isoaspartate(D-aspartate) O-methyltransferase [Candidatus Diapherotrites archaeon]